MKKRKRKYQDLSPVEFLLLREKLGLRRFLKHEKRDDEKRRILLELGLKKIRQKEKKDFTIIGYRKRKVEI